MTRQDGNGMTLVKSFECALRGALLPLSERNMRIHCIAAVIAITMGILLKISNIEFCAIIIVIGNVISKEVQNSAYEDLADACCPDHHPKIRDGKDKAAGAVLWAAFEAVAVGLIIFGLKLMALYN
jgi:diacylglycerol kinase